MEEQSLMHQILAWAPMTLISIAWAWGAYWIAPKIGQNRWLWIALLLVPMMNFLSVTVFGILILNSVINRLDSLAKTLSKPHDPGVA